MNRFSMLSKAPKGALTVPKPGTPSDVATPNVRKSRTIKPAAASTRDYGKQDPIGSDLFGSPSGRLGGI